jgi:hypothetical protein
MLVVPDHYVVRMLYSPGRGDGGPGPRAPRRRPQRDRPARHLAPLLRALPPVRRHPHRAVAQARADRALRRRGAPDRGQRRRAVRPPRRAPRATRVPAARAVRRLGIEVLCTTDAATDELDTHHRLQAEGLPVRPTFRPDAVIDPQRDDWAPSLALLARAQRGGGRRLRRLPARAARAARRLPRRRRHRHRPRRPHRRRRGARARARPRASTTGCARRRLDRRAPRFASHMLSRWRA